MAWINNQPSPTQNISNGQSTILNNFQFLGDSSTRSGQTATSSDGITSTGGYYKLPNGLIIQYFITDSTSDNKKVQFLTNFTNPSSVLCIQCTPCVNASSAGSVSVDNSAGSIIASRFIIRCSKPFSTGVFVIAIGF